MRQLCSLVMALVMVAAACSSTTETAGERRAPDPLDSVVVAPDPPASSVATPSAEPSATVAEPAPTPFLLGPSPAEVWSAAESTRDVANYLEALRQGAFEQAAWPAASAGAVFEGQARDESGAEYLALACAGDQCTGPYLIRGAPGYARSTADPGIALVGTEHLLTGEMGGVALGTVEGQRYVAMLPPLATGANDASLRTSLFDDTQPETVVIERFEAFEIWAGESTVWLTNWHADEAIQVEGDIVATWSGAFGLQDSQRKAAGGCVRLMERDSRLLGVVGCQHTETSYVEFGSGTAVEPPVAPQDLGDGDWRWFAERGGATLIGLGNAEGNLREMSSLTGTDLLQGDSAGLIQISVDGSMVAYVDHRDPAAASHFHSPAVVVRSIASGDEIGRWVLDGAVMCLEFAIDWIVACEAAQATLASGRPEQEALAAINVSTGKINRVFTGTSVFLPAIAPAIAP